MTGLQVLQIGGTVSRAGRPVEAAYLALVQGDEFIAECRTGPDGTYAFQVPPGRWMIVCRAAGFTPHIEELEAATGSTRLDFVLDAGADGG